MSLFTSLSKA